MLVQAELVKESSSVKQLYKNDTRIKILVVEDDAIDAAFISDSLMFKGFNIVKTENGLEAIDIFQ